MNAGKYRIEKLSNCDGGMNLGNGPAELEYRPNGESILIIKDGASKAANCLDLSKHVPRDGFIVRINGDRFVNLGKVSWKSGEDMGERQYTLRGAKYLPIPGNR